MAIAFACPGCATPFNVTDDMAGKRAKCPKCLMVFTLPAAQPVAAASKAAEKAASDAVTDLFHNPERFDPDRKSGSKSGRSRVDTEDQDEPRPRSAKTKKAKGSALPWILGLGGLALLLIVFCGGAIVVVAVIAFRGEDKKAVAKVNPPQGGKPIPVGPGPGKPPVNPAPGQIVQLVQGPAFRVSLANGAFQTINTLEQNDTADPKDVRYRCKLYQIELQAGRNYTIDMESREFDAYLRLEDPNGGQVAEDDDSGGNLNARIMYTPPRTGLYVVVATSYHVQVRGQYRLTVRESGLPMPGGPFQ
jgi:predicted Zn finger-like uncharacterized protein